MSREILAALDVGTEAYVVIAIRTVISSQATYAAQTLWRHVEDRAAIRLQRRRVGCAIIGLNRERAGSGLVRRSGREHRASSDNHLEWKR